MTLVRYNPLNGFVPATFGDLIENALRTANNSDVIFKPSVDVFKDEKQIEIQLLVPGMKKEDFKIDIEKNQLAISGERKLADGLVSKVQKTESVYGKFRRVFNLSDDVDQEKISASYKEGILSIQLPLVEEKTNKSIIKVK